MPYKLNGINYTEMLLTDEELAVVKAMRDGAAIQVDYWIESYTDEVIDKANVFGNVDTIFDLDNSVAFNSNNYSKVNCTVYLWK